MSDPGEGSAAGVLAAMCTGFFMVLLDTTALNVALPALGRDLGASAPALQWSVTAYAVAMACALLGCGAIADRYGPDRVFRVSVVAFALASLACALSPALGPLVAARVAQGAAAGGLLPTSLAVVAHTFRTPVRRARALAVWGGVSSFSLILGPVLGGLLTAFTSWRAVFLINVPIAAFSWWLTRRCVPPLPTGDARLDLPGQLTATVTIGAAVGGLIEGGAHGWTGPRCLALLATAAGAAVCFAVVESRVAVPMLPPALLWRPGLRRALLISALFQFGAYGAMFVLAIHLQGRWGLNAWQAGLSFAPLAVAWMAGSLALAPRFAAASTRVPVALGGAVAAAGAVAFAALGARGPSGWAILTVAGGLLGAGAGLMAPFLPVSVLAELPVRQAGLGSALLNAARQIGGAIGIAVLGRLVLGRPVPGRPALGHPMLGHPMLGLPVLGPDAALPTAMVVVAVTLAAAALLGSRPAGAGEPVRPAPGNQRNSRSRLPRTRPSRYTVDDR